MDPGPNYRSNNKIKSSVKHQDILSKLDFCMQSHVLRFPAILGPENNPLLTKQQLYNHNIPYYACTRFSCMHKILVHAQHSLCMHHTLVHAQHSGACTTLLFMRNTLVHAQDSFLCMHKNLVLAQESCACARILSFWYIFTTFGFLFDSHILTREPSRMVREGLRSILDLDPLNKCVFQYICLELLGIGIAYNCLLSIGLPIGLPIGLCTHWV